MYIDLRHSPRASAAQKRVKTFFQGGSEVNIFHLDAQVWAVFQKQIQEKLIIIQICTVQNMLYTIKH